MSAEQGGVARYRLVGVTDERDSCDCCGRTDLKRVVVLHDGDDHVFFGSHCTARLLGKPVGDVNREATAGQRQRAHAERTARQAAQREAKRAEALAAESVPTSTGSTPPCWRGRACGSPATRRRSPAAAPACRSATAPRSTATWRPAPPTASATAPTPGEGGHER
jgi:hypothetical protein